MRTLGREREKELGVCKNPVNDGERFGIEIHVLKKQATVCQEILGFLTLFRWWISQRRYFWRFKAMNGCFFLLNECSLVGADDLKHVRLLKAAGR